MKLSKSHSVVSNSLQPHGIYSPWNSPGQNTAVGSLSLLQGIFPTQGSNPELLHCGWIFYQLSHKGNTWCAINVKFQRQTFCLPSHFFPVCCIWDSKYTSHQGSSFFFFPRNSSRNRKWYCRVGKSIGFVFKTEVCHLWALWPWAGCFAIFEPWFPPLSDSITLTVW